MTPHERALEERRRRIHEVHLQVERWHEQDLELQRALAYAIEERDWYSIESVRQRLCKRNQERYYAMQPIIALLHAGPPQAPRGRDWSIYIVHIDGGPSQYAKVRAPDGAIGVGRPVTIQREGETRWHAGVVVEPPADHPPEGGGPVWVQLTPPAEGTSRPTRERS